MAWIRWTDDERRALYGLRTIFNVPYPKCVQILNKQFKNERSVAACSSQMVLLNGETVDNLAWKLGMEPHFFKANRKLAQGDLFGVYDDGRGNFTIKG